MEAKVVLDISAIVWDENDFNTNQYSYYTLKSEVFLFIQAFENCNNLKFVAREELLNNIRVLFPYKTCNEHKMFDFQRLVLQFLATKRNVSYRAITSAINSFPNICFQYFSDDLQTEIGYLITEIHNSADEHVFCTFSTRWQNNPDLQTKNNISKTHKTIIHENTKSTVKDFYLNNIRKVFEHNSKHDRIKGRREEDDKWIYPLTCFDGKNLSIPQNLLDNATQYGNDFYNYDDANQTFVCFKSHLDNKYHGYDEDIKNVPQKIREEFHK
ncbi:MAG: hypothetical protein LBQ31_04530 [Bacteroidales bacterium]|jgi:hypothetical protein|nr:hypothetical protein [Bacteroidales bacterium]